MLFIIWLVIGVINAGFIRLTGKKRLSVLEWLGIIVTGPVYYLFDLIDYLSKTKL